MKAEKVYDQTFTARNFNTSPLTISGLEGDTYDYELIMQTPGTTTYSYYYLTLNSDTTANYRAYGMRGRATSAAASVSDAASRLDLFESGSTGQTDHLAMVKITGSSGDERYLDAFYSSNDNTNNSVWKKSLYWKNTADEVTSITFTSGVSVTIDAHIILYRTPKEASQEKWELVETKSWTSSNSDQTFTVDGNQDINYRVVIKSDGGNFNFRLNSDSGSNYTRQNLKNIGGSISAANSTLTFAEIVDSGDINDAEIIINAESGVKRLCISSVSGEGVLRDQSENSIWWNNIADNLTAITLRMDLNTGTAWLYRRKNPNTIGDTLPFEMVEEVAVSGDFSAGHTFSGLSGDDVLLYKLEFIGDTGETAPDVQMRCQLNGDTASNYPRQWLRGYGSTTNAVSSTLSYFLLGSGVYGESKIEFYLYPKSGENRTLLSTAEERYNGGYQVLKQGAWWNNSSDEINSIKVFAGATTSLTGTLKLSRIVNKRPSFDVNAADTNGSTMSFSLADTSAVDASTGISVFGWIKKDALSNKGIACKLQSSGNQRAWYLFWDNTASNTLEVSLSSTGGASFAFGNSSTSLSAGVWYHVGFTWDGTTCRFYVDGAADGTFAASAANLYNSSAPYEVGALDGGSLWDGGLYQFCMSKNVLDTTQISELYNDGMPLPFDNWSSSLKAEFNGGNGVVHRLGNFADNSGNELLDLTDGSNTITNNNSTPFTETGLTTRI